MKISNLLTPPAAALALMLLLSMGTFAQHDQKGVDTQTQTIKEESNKVTSRPNDATHSINWGSGKTKVRDLLPNPYKMNSRRDVLVNTIIDALKDKKIVVDDASSRLGEGIIVTQPFVFAKGAVITRSHVGYAPYAACCGNNAFCAARINSHNSRTAPRPPSQ